MPQTVRGIGEAPKSGGSALMMQMVQEMPKNLIKININRPAAESLAPIAQPAPKRPKVPPPPPTHPRRLRRCMGGGVGGACVPGWVRPAPYPCSPGLRPGETGRDRVPMRARPETRRRGWGYASHEALWSDLPACARVVTQWNVRVDQTDERARTAAALRSVGSHRREGPHTDDRALTPTRGPSPWSHGCAAGPLAYSLRRKSPPAGHTDEQSQRRVSLDACIITLNVTRGTMADARVTRRST